MPHASKRPAHFWNILANVVRVKVTLTNFGPDPIDSAPNLAVHPDAIDTAPIPVGVGQHVAGPIRPSSTSNAADSEANLAQIGPEFVRNRPHGAHFRGRSGPSGVRYGRHRSSLADFGPCFADSEYARLVTRASSLIEIT